jgi:hypothetical protein
MVAVQLQEPIANDQPQPEKQRIVRLAQVFIEPTYYIDISLLDYVGRVDSRLEPAVEAQLDHTPQPGSVLGKNLIQSRLVPGASQFQQAGCIG